MFKNLYQKKKSLLYYKISFLTKVFRKNIKIFIKIFVLFPQKNFHKKIFIKKFSRKKFVPDRLHNSIRNFNSDIKLLKIDSNRYSIRYDH